jgi:hypothetical protein
VSRSVCVCARDAHVVRTLESHATYPGRQRAALTEGNASHSDRTLRVLSVRESGDSGAVIFPVTASDGIRPTVVFTASSSL